MSIFTRPDSPPPRQPSPDFVPVPLPSPHLRARLRKSSSKQSLSPSVPPGLEPSPGPRNFLHPTRSHDHLNERSERRRTSSNPIVSPRAASHSMPQIAIPSTSLSVDHSRPYRRYISNATTYRSPPPSPTISSPPPPVPPIPTFVATAPKGVHSSQPMSMASISAFVATAPKDVKPVHPSEQMSAAPIRLPDFDNVSPMSESTFLPRQRPKGRLSQKHGSVGMTCLKFLSLRNTKPKVA